MKIGLSTYSLDKVIARGEMTILDVIEWAAEHGAEHVELVPFAYNLLDNPNLADAVSQKAAEVGISLSNYCLLSNHTQEDETEFRMEIERVKRHVDLVHRLGIKLMRHDVAWVRTPPGGNSGPAGLYMDDASTGIRRFERELPRMVTACREIADYAAQFGITTTVENHLYYVQQSDRVQRLIQSVNRPNYRTTLDVGNFLCVDEDPVVGVKKNLPYAAMVHLKDFFYRPSYRNPGEGWFRTSTGNYLRGTIFGHGDIDTPEIMRVLKRAGYTGFASIEFEGIEDPLFGARVGLDNARRLWNEA